MGQRSSNSNAAVSADGYSLPPGLLIRRFRTGSFLHVPSRPPTPPRAALIAAMLGQFVKSASRAGSLLGATNALI